MTDNELRAKIRQIIHLTRNPNAPDVWSLEKKQNEFGYTLRKCPVCGSWENHKQFYSHYSRDHRPDWKVDMLMEVIRNETA